MKYLTLLMCFCFLNVYAQNYSTRWQDEILNQDEKKYSDYFEETKILDLSCILLNEEHHEHFIGFIGKDYERLSVHFYTVIKNRNNDVQYYVRGKTKVKDEIKLFLGSMEVLYSKIYAAQDDSVKRGFAIASYQFFELPDYDKSGSFTGIVKLNWSLDKSGKVFYDDLNFDQTDYASNCGFVGVWKEYNSKTELTCNFGEYRIPFATDLDVGVGEFMPAEEYRNNGWEDFFIVTDGGEPDKKWWQEY